MDKFIGLPRHVTWVTKERQEIQIQNMDASHLEHTIRMLDYLIDGDKLAILNVHDPNKALKRKLELSVMRKELYIRIMKGELMYRRRNGVDQ